MWLRFSSRPQFWTRAHNPVGPQPDWYNIGVTWSRKWSFKMAMTKVTELGYSLTKLPFWLSLWHDIWISWHGGQVWYVLPTMPSIRGLRWCRYSTKKCLPDSHLTFVYVIILSISPIWRIGETNPSTKTFKILFSIVMPTFGKSCQRPWLHGIKKWQKPKLSWIFKQIFQDGSHGTCTRTLGRKNTRKSASFW